MQVSLTITGSAAALARVLATLPQDATVTGSLTPPSTSPFPAMPVPPAAAGDDDDGGLPDPNAPAVDANGLPWDERIHSSNRKTKADGSWTMKRGASKELIAQVEAELRGGGALPQPVPMPQPMQMPVAPMAQPPMPVPQQMQPPVPVAAQPTMPQPMPMPEPVAQPPVPQPMPEPVPVAAQPPAAAGAPTFEGFMEHLMNQMKVPDAAGMPKIHADYLADLVQRVSTAWSVPLTAITDIQSRPDMIPWTIQLIQTDGRW